MIPKKQPRNTPFLFSDYETLLNHKNPLFILANKINWQIFEDAFLPLYSKDKGRPGKPIRMMVGLLILKHLRNISDESVVEQWSENMYFQYMCGEVRIAAGAPCEASELVYFRKRIGESGIELILKESIRINQDDAQDDDVIVDTTVQEKNITFPTDDKMFKKIIRACWKIASINGIKLRQRILSDWIYSKRHLHKREMTGIKFIHFMSRTQNVFRKERSIRNMNLAIRHRLQRPSAALLWAPWASEMNLTDIH